MNKENFKEGSLYTYGDLIVKNGEIVGNEFNYNISSSQASTWIINNEKKVMNKINYYLRVLNVPGGDREDCFNFAIYYFLDKKEREVVLNFFGEGTDYGIGKYCMSNLKFAVYGYKNNLKKLRGEGTTSLVDAKDTEEKGKGYSIEDITYNNSLSQSDKMYGSPLQIIEDSEMKERFKLDMLQFTDYFKEEGYKVFDILNVFSYMFFNISQREEILEKDKSALRTSIYEWVAEETGESKYLIESMFKSIYKGYKEGLEIESSIYDTLNYYVYEQLNNIEYERTDVEVDDWEDIEKMYK